MASGAGNEFRRRKRKLSALSSSRSRSNSSDSEIENDLFGSAIPPDTSSWDLLCLQSLSVFYESTPCPLSEIMDKCELFPPLNNDLQDMLTTYKNSLNFDVDIGALKKMNSKTFVDKFIRDSLQEAKRSIVETAKLSEKMCFAVKPVINFIDDTSCMTYKVRSGKDNEAVYKQCFISFVSMCQLSPKNGDVCKRVQKINGIDVSSCPDLRIKCTDACFVNDEQDREAVVTIAGVKKYKADKLPPEKRDTCSKTSPHVVREIPSICESLDPSVVGRHGGQLLLEWQLCRIKLRYVPGIIVYGSKIIFTLLDMTEHHMEKLLSDEDLEADETAHIFYTEAFDIMKKIDRDIVMETCLRLSMYTM